MQYNSQTTPQTLDRDLIDESSKWTHLEMLLSPSCSSPPPPLLLGNALWGLTLSWIIIHGQNEEYTEGFSKYMGQPIVQKSLTRWEERAEQHSAAADTLAYLISWDSCSASCTELSRDPAALTTRGILDLRLGGTKGGPSDLFFISPSGESSKEACKSSRKWSNEASNLATIHGSRHLAMLFTRTW